MVAALELDSTIEFQAVVYGSLPPGGRDLDLLLADGDFEKLETTLEGIGYHRRSIGWVRARSRDLDIVDPARLTEMGLGPEASARLVAQSLAIPRLRNLRRPAPHHALLLAARRAARNGKVAPKLRSRMIEALREDPSAGELARSEAKLWAVEEALEVLLGAAPESMLGRSSRVRVIFAEAKQAGKPTPLAAGSAIKAILPAYRTGMLVSLSGLDGSGKSTQAESLGRALSTVGRDPHIAWVSMVAPELVDRGARRIKRILKPLVSSRPRPLKRKEVQGLPAVARDAHELDAREPARVLRRGSPTLTSAWSTVVAVSVGLRHGFSIRRRLLRGEDVICDRYLLDAWKFMRYHYGQASSLNLQWRIISVLLPAPDAAFLLNVSPEVASERKFDFTADQNAKRLAYLREKTAELGVTDINGTQAAEDVAAEIAIAVLDRLEL